MNVWSGSSGCLLKTAAAAAGSETDETEPYSKCAVKLKLLA